MKERVEKDQVWEGQRERELESTGISRVVSLGELEP